MLMLLLHAQLAVASCCVHGNQQLLSGEHQLMVADFGGINSRGAAAVPRWVANAKLGSAGMECEMRHKAAAPAATRRVHGSTLDHASEASSASAPSVRVPTRS